MEIQDYKSVPIGSLLTLEKEKQEQLRELFFNVPDKVRGMLAANKTGSFLVGSLRSYNVPLSYAPKVALLVFMIGVGIKSLQNVASELKSIGIPQDAANNLSREIEQELFAPVALEYNQYVKLMSQKQTPASGMHNVLDLKAQEQTKRKSLTLPAPGAKPTSPGHIFSEQ